MAKKDILGLVCSGGGAHGAYQVGVLKYVHEKFSRGQASPFQVFAGSSCGALNTTFFSAQSSDAAQSSLWLEDLWLHFHVPGYHGNLFKNTLKTFYHQWRKKPAHRTEAWSLFSPGPMKDVIQKGFIRENFEKALKAGTTLASAIAATEMISGRSCWFQEGEKAKEWNLFHSIGIKTRLEGVHLEASCSVPLFLPPVKIGEHYFVDGSVGLERPLAAAALMGANRIMTIATDRPVPTSLPQYPAGFKPRFTNIMRLLMNRLSHDPATGETIQIQMMNRFYRVLSAAKKAENQGVPGIPIEDDSMAAHYNPVSVYMFYPSKRIRDFYGFEKRAPETPKRTRFMFHTKFIRELITLGYEDARSRHEALKDFFCEETARKWTFFRKSDSGEKAA